MTYNTWSVRQGWAVDKAPTDLLNGPTTRGVVNTPLPIKLLSFASPSRHLREGVKSNCSGAFKPNRLGLSCKVGTGDLGVLTTHVSPLVKPALPAPDECRHKLKLLQHLV